MNKLLWFFYRPTDEREQALYARAYRRALVVLTVYWLGDFLPIFSPAWAQQMQTESWLPTTVAYGIVAYLAGLFVFRHEEIGTTDLRPLFRAHWYFAGLSIWAGLGLVMYFGAVEFSLTGSRTFMTVGSGLLLLVYAYVALIAWLVMPVSGSLVRRVLLVLFFPVPTTFWFRFTKRSRAGRLARTIIYSALTLVIGGGFAWLAYSNTIRPEVLSNFPSDYPNNIQLYLDRRIQEYQVGDLVAVSGRIAMSASTEAREYFGPARVVAKQGDRYTVTTPFGTLQGSPEASTATPMNLSALQQSVQQRLQDGYGSLQGEYVQGKNWLTILLSPVKP